MNKLAITLAAVAMALLLALGANNTWAGVGTVTVGLKASDGVTGVSGAKVSYYRGGQQQLGYTDDSGIFSAYITDITSTTTIYLDPPSGGTRTWLQVDPATNPVLTAQMVAVTVELKTCEGTALTGQAKYYKSGWQSLGNTPVTVDLLPYTGLGPGQGSYDFQVIYNGRTSATWRQDIAVDPLIVFRTTKVTSTYVGNAYYYNGGWQLFSSPSELMGGTENISPYGTKTADFKFGGTSGTYPTYTFYITGCDLTVGPPLFTITATAGDDGSVTPAEVTSVNSGGSQTYTITPNTGYHVADVLVDNSSVGAVTSYPFTNVTTNHTISASFEIDTYQLTVSSTTGGLISAPSSSPVTVDYGVATTITAAASPGYTFSGWTVVHQLPLHQT